MKTLHLITSLVFISSVALPVFGATKKELQEAEHEVTKTCTKEYPKELKGKDFKAINAWAEKSEYGDKKAEFKKSKCHDAHEKWEKVAGKAEPRGDDD